MAPPPPGLPSCESAVLATPATLDIVKSHANGAAPAPTPSSDAHSPDDLSRYLSAEGRLRQSGTLRSLVGRFQGAHDVVSLSAGFPPSHVFPYSGLTLRLSDGTAIDLPDPLAAQQYCTSLRGYPPLLNWATTHTQSLHAPPGPHATLITNGANHTLELLTSLFLDRGDAILVEEYTYPVILESIATPKGYRVLGVPIDDGGIVPEGLAAVLSAAAAAAAAGGPKMPKLLYTVPTGHNPTGCSIAPERRRVIYELCRSYDVWIVEDDPYYYLQWDAAAETLLSADPEGLDETVLRAAVPGLSGLSAGAGSYLSLDVDCRVIRVDSFAKFLAPGVRLGWVTARSDVIDKLTAAIQTHTVGPCSLSQSVVAATLMTWGDSGLDAHLRRVQAEYARRCSVLCAAAATELRGLASWRAPRAGMFLWVRLHGIEEATDVWEELAEEKVIVCPGRVMAAASDVKSPFIRVAYSSATVDGLKEGMARLGRVLRRRAGRVAAASLSYPPTPPPPPPPPQFSTHLVTFCSFYHIKHSIIMIVYTFDRFV